MCANGGTFCESLLCSESTACSQLMMVKKSVFENDACDEDDEKRRCTYTKCGLIIMRGCVSAVAKRTRDGDEDVDFLGGSFMEAKHYFLSAEFAE